MSQKGCSLEQGPNCFFLSSVNPNENFTNSKMTINNALNKYKSQITKTKKKNTNEHGSNINLDQKMELRLLLTFESYDQLTKEKDIYMPEELNTEYEKGNIHLKFKGKLKLTQKNQIKNKESETADSKKEVLPDGPYGIIEGEQVIVEFDNPSYVKSLYIKKNMDFKSQTKDFTLVGFKDGNNIILGTKKNVPHDKWTKVVLKDELLDGFILPKGIDVDNIKISYSFEVNALEEQLTKVVDQLLEEKTLESFKSKQGNVKVVAMEYDPKTGKLREVDMDNLDLNDNDE